MNNSYRKKKKLTRPIVMAFKFLQKQTKVEIWLNEDMDTRYTGTIVGMDEYMNLTLDGTMEHNSKLGTEKRLGKIVMKQDNICLIHSLDEMNL